MAVGTEAAKRLTAEARRETVLEVALSAFATGGLHGTSTEDIARRAGISHPYLFRLFGTKKDLFIAVVERCFSETLEAFRSAARGREDDARALRDLGRAYIDLLADRDLLLVQLHAYAACEDPDVRAVVRGGYGEIFRLVERVVGGDDEAVRGFFATGMLVNVITAMDLMTDPPDRWARTLVRPFRRKE